MRQAGTFLKNFVRPWTKGGSRGSNRQKGGEQRERPGVLAGGGTVPGTAVAHRADVAVR